MDWSWYLVRFDGRINRALLWQALLMILLMAGLLGMICQAIKVPDGTESPAVDFSLDLQDFFKALDPRAYRLLAPTDRLGLIVKLLGTSPLLWIYLATAIKRLHDRDRSGRWIVPFLIVPALFDQFEPLLPRSYWMLPFGLATQALWLWGAIEMFCLRGTSASNRFGPDPLADSAENSASPPRPASGWDQQSEIEFVPPRASPPGGMHVKRDT